MWHGERHGGRRVYTFPTTLPTGANLSGYPTRVSFPLPGASGLDHQHNVRVGKLMGIRLLLGMDREKLVRPLAGKGRSTKAYYCKGPYLDRFAVMRVKTVPHRHGVPRYVSCLFGGL